MPVTASLLALFGLSLAAPCGIIPRTPEVTRQPACLHREAEDLPASVRIEHAPDFVGVLPSDRKYKVECRVISDTLTFSLPAFVVNDGNKCTISDLVLSRYEVGAVREQATRVPIVREVRSGSKFEWTVIAAEGGQLVLDVTSEFQGTDNQLPAEDGSSIRVRCVKIRAIERARLGDRVIIPFDGGRIEATVRDASTSD